MRSVLQIAIVVVLAACSVTTVSAQCSAYNYCSSCVAAGCGWEGDMNTCASGTSTGPYSGDSTQWIYGAGANCAGSGINSNCYDQYSCSFCVGESNCGWTGSSCVPGNSAGPYSGSYTTWTYGWGSYCSGSGSNGIIVSTSIGLAAWVIVVIIIGGLACTFFIIFACCYSYRRRQQVVVADVTYTVYNPAVVPQQQVYGAVTYA